MAQKKKQNQKQNQKKKSKRENKFSHMYKGVLRPPPPIFILLGGFLLTFDFEKFANITASVYPQSVYSLKDTLSVFEYYFEQYEQHMKKPHPPIKASQIVQICQNMPYITPENRRGCEDLCPIAYRAMIDKHFNTKYRHCDFNINHFFSGRIRELRFFEECY